jgi:hypothetical protein
VSRGPLIPRVQTKADLDLQRYAFQNWIYHFIFTTNHHTRALDKAIRIIDTPLEQFGIWMTRAGSLIAVRRIKTDLTASSSRLREIQHPVLQSKLEAVIERVDVRRFRYITPRTSGLPILQQVNRDLDLVPS